MVRWIRPVVSMLTVAGCASSEPASPGRPPGPGSTGRDDAGAPVEPPTPPGTRCGAPRDTSVPRSDQPRFCELPGADAPELTVPEGFCAREFTTTPVAEARVMRFAPNGDLFVAAPSQAAPGGAAGGPGAIIVLADEDRDGRADVMVTYAGGRSGPASSDCGQAESDPSDLSCVHGLAFAGDYLYYTRSDEVRRFAHVRGDRSAPAPAGELVATLGGRAIGARWTHTVDARDGQLLVSRGRFDAAQCSAQEMATGAVFSITPSGGLPAPLTLVADGFRNPMYLRCRAACGDCFANELSGDAWDGIGGHEKLVLLEPKTTWGFPCCVTQNTPAPGGTPKECGGLGAERISVPLHDTPFGLDFETGVFGAPYTYAVFTALHGSFGGWAGTAISWAPTDPVTHAPTGTFKTFATGWGLGGPMRGRATDVTFAPDGRLFVSDDVSGRIFWIAPRTLIRP